MTGKDEKHKDYFLGNSIVFSSFKYSLFWSHAFCHQKFKDWISIEVAIE
jgi:hypothetical protein